MNSVIDIMAIKPVFSGAFLALRSGWWPFNRRSSWPEKEERSSYRYDDS
jgi:hypothetical protein